MKCVYAKNTYSIHRSASLPLFRTTMTPDSSVHNISRCVPSDFHDIPQITTCAKTCLVKSICIQE